MNERIKEMSRFGITGTVSTIVTYVVYYLCLKLTNPTVAFFIGYFIAFIVNYIMTLTFTFKVKASVKNGAGFIISNIINFFLCEVFLNIFISIGVAKQWAPIPMFAVCVPINFLLVRYAMKKL